MKVKGKAHYQAKEKHPGDVFCVWLLYFDSLKIVPKGPINNNPALV